MSGKKGTRKSDRRWIDGTGEEWDSEFEYLVYTSLKGAGYNLRRCDERDTINYSTQVRNSNCLDCSSSRVVQRRVYNSDLYVMEGKSPSEAGGYLLELKGYFPATKRALFRAIAKQCEEDGISLRILFESPYKMRGTKNTGPEYINKYCKNVIPGTFNKKTGEVTWYER